MLEQKDREASTEYGPWPWITGYAIGGVLVALMFGLAAGLP
jgi:hypothetical protein